MAGKIVESGATFHGYNNHRQLSEQIKNAYSVAESIVENFDFVIYEQFFFLGKHLAEKYGKPVARIFTAPVTNQKLMAEFITSKGPLSIFKHKWIARAFAKDIAKNISMKTDNWLGLFCNESGYQTPKIDTRAAIFKDNKILLVHENNGTWALPGGWCDVNVSVAANVIKEVKEEAGLDVVAEKIIAVQDRAKHNLPLYAYGVCKIFMLCKVLGGNFEPNIETVGFDYFDVFVFGDEVAKGKPNPDIFLKACLLCNILIKR